VAEDEVLETASFISRKKSMRLIEAIQGETSPVEAKINM